MASVDDRIVQMQFDNSSFEKKLDTTLKSLANLEKALKFEGAQHGLSNVQGSVDKFHLGSIGTHIEGVSAKFLALSTVAITVLSNIVTAAMRSGTQIAKSLTLDRIIDGFKEYELNISSIQTILSNTKAEGTSLDQVNEALAQLNKYADQTIYNFGQMTKNIGTFTAAGVDLETSVMSIKGISNVAAISGSSAEQAANAMYQLSQAVSSGTLKLIDWNSVVNAGMGGEVLQKALFETGKAMGTLKDVPLEQTFQQWKDSGNSFRSSLEKEWVTAEVLTTTLKGFTGEMTEAQLAAVGFTEAQVKEFIELGKTGVEAATKVRTLTQLIATTKEAIGSGWSESFKLIVGNFEEATTLFSGISGAIGKVVGDAADSRNELLKGWNEMGGRALFIENLRMAFRNLGEMLEPIKDAFREIFPKTTMFQLMDFTKAFTELVIKMRPSAKTVENIHAIFKGLFSVLQIGWEILKETAKFFVNLFSSLGAGSGKFLSFAGTIGEFFTQLNNQLIEGKGIKNFFETLAAAVQLPIAFLKDLIDLIKNFFTSFGDSAIVDASGEAFGRLSDRFETLSKIFERMSDLWKPVKDGLDAIVRVLDAVWDALKNWFVDLGDKLAAVMKPGDFDKVLDALNVGLLGGVVLMMQRFFKHGLKLDIGAGFLDRIGKSFDALTGTLTAMQTNIKANALLKIAGAIGILTASVLVLSLIDSAALTKALTAMAVGFGQLMASFAIITKMQLGPMSAASFDLIAGGMILVATSMLILAGAVKILSTLSWEEMAKGLIAVTVLLGVVTAAIIPLSSMSGGMIAAGAGLIALGIGLNIIAVALKIFATMSWEEMAKGLVTLGTALTVIGLATKHMSMTLPSTGLALIGIGIALNAIAIAMKIMASMSWEEIAKGLVAVAGALVIIGLATKHMSATLPSTGVALVLIGVALNAIASAMKIFGTMSWEEMAKGLTAMAGSLIILGAATKFMSSSIIGAVAIGVVAASLLILAKALKEFAKITWDELIHGLVAIAAALAVLGLAAYALQPAIGAMLGVGAALVVIGLGFALIGVGVNQLAKGFEVLARTGADAVLVIPEVFKAIGKGMPALFHGLAEGLIEMVQMFADAIPVLVKAIVVILGHIIDGLVELIPKAISAIGKLIGGIIKYVSETAVPQLVEAGFKIVLALLAGIRDNAGPIVESVADILENFLNAMSEEMPRVATALGRMIEEMFLAVAETLGHIAGRLLFGVGVAFITGLMDGISDSAAGGPIKWFGELAGNVLKWIGDTLKTLWDKGAGFITGLLGGITQKITDVTTFFQNLGSNIVKWIGDSLNLLKDIGGKVITGFFDGIKATWTTVTGWLGQIGDFIRYHIPNPITILYNAGKDIVQGLWNGIRSLWDRVWDWVSDQIKRIPGFIRKIMGIDSPSKVMMDIGEMMVLGLALPFKNDTTTESNIEGYVERSTKAFKNSLATITESLGDVTEFQPTITPILDLTEVKSAAQKITDYISMSPVIPISASYDQAQSIATGTGALKQTETVSTTPVPPSGVTFEQNIYAPSQLSTSDIYKQTRNQITMAKEELSIL